MSEPQRAAIRPFRIDVPEAVLSDLARRLQATRWPDAELVKDWSQGVPLAWLQNICKYWAESYNWRERETLLNGFDQYITQIDGLDVHFIHQRSPHPGARPLLITHGWPGSVVEFHKVIAPLVDPVAFGGKASDAFHVICPSLPGFGFSGKPMDTGWGVARIAGLWASLMARLGYPRYFAQGGDWGSAVTRALGAVDGAHCAGIHVTLTMGLRPLINGEPSAEEQHALARAKYYQEWDSGYSSQQGTRPQTVGYGLADSPVGQAAWILEKFWAWTDCDGDPLHLLTKDELLDNIMVYWVTNSATSSARLYWESFGRGRIKLPPVAVPVGVAVYPKEIVPPVKAWMVNDYPDIRHFVTMPKGGHFAAMEQPQLYLDDVRSCFNKLAL